MWPTFQVRLIYITFYNKCTRYIYLRFGTTLVYVICDVNEWDNCDISSLYEKLLFAFFQQTLIISTLLSLHISPTGNSVGIEDEEKCTTSLGHWTVRDE